MIDKIYQSPIIYNLICKLPKLIKKPIVSLAHYLRKTILDKLETPKVLTFFVTNRCNARCKHCFYWKELNKPTDEMTISQIKKFVKSLKHPLASVLLTGGEPFLRKDLIEICQIFSEENKTTKVIIPTNGYLSEHISNSVNEILDKTNLYVDIMLSLDGFEKDVAELRGLKDIFEKNNNTIKLLKQIKNKRLRVFLLTTITEKNYDKIIPLIEFNKSNWNIPHKFQYVRSSNEVYNIDSKIVPNFSQKNKDFCLPSLDKINKLNKKLKRRIKTDSVSIAINHLEKELALGILKNKKRPIPCLAGIYDGVVFPNGDVSLCEFTKSIGNLKETNFDFWKLWYSKSANKMRDKIKNCACMHSCNLIDSMTHDKKTIERLFNG